MKTIMYSWCIVYMDSENKFKMVLAKKDVNIVTSEMGRTALVYRNDENKDVVVTDVSSIGKLSLSSSRPLIKLLNLAYIKDVTIANDLLTILELRYGVKMDDDIKYIYETLKTRLTIDVFDNSMFLNGRINDSMQASLVVDIISNTYREQ